MPPKPTTVGESLYWSYANLAMAHAAVSAGQPVWNRTSYMIRSKLYKGLCAGKMNLGSLKEDERVKMMLPRACCYCGVDGKLSLDHLVPTARGGTDEADNIVWSCRSCNSSKGARDLLVWYAERGVFPPLLLLRRYLKLAIVHFQRSGELETPLENLAELDAPFVLSAVPQIYPAPSELVEWVTAG